jgi:hypothetical protein
MSDYGSIDDIKRKTREGVYSAIAKDYSKNELRKYFVDITSVTNGQVIKLPYVSRVKCSSFRTYNSSSGGISSIRHVTPTAASQKVHRHLHHLWTGRAGPKV